MTDKYSALKDNLQILKLPFISENFVKASAHAVRKKLDYITFFENLIDGEVTFLAFITQHIYVTLMLTIS